MRVFPSLVFECGRPSGESTGRDRTFAQTDSLRHPKTMERQSCLNVLEQSRRQPVDADGVFLAPIGLESVLALGAGPVLERRTLAAIVEQRIPISAGRLD